MAGKSSSGPIPDGWRFEILKKKDGSKVPSYCCPRTGQRFFTYEDMMRYVIYAKKAGLPLYVPNFHWTKRIQNAGQSSVSADDQIEEKLESEKGIDIDKSLDSKKGANIEKSLDSKKSADAGENLEPQNDPSENLSAASADNLTHDDLVLLQQIPNVPHVASAAGIQSLEDPFIVEQRVNIPSVVGTLPSEEDSPQVALTPGIIPEFAVGNPRSSSGPGASKPRHFRRWGY